MIRTQEDEVKRIKKEDPTALIVNFRAGENFDEQIKSTTSNKFTLSDFEKTNENDFSIKLKDKNLYFVYDDETIFDKRLFKEIIKKEKYSPESKMIVKKDDSDINYLARLEKIEINFEGRDIAVYPEENEFLVVKDIKPLKQKIQASQQTSKERKLKI